MKLRVNLEEPMRQLWTAIRHALPGKCVRRTANTRSYGLFKRRIGGLNLRLPISKSLFDQLEHESGNRLGFFLYRSFILLSGNRSGRV